MNDFYNLWKERFSKFHGTGEQQNYSKNMSVPVGPYKVNLFNTISEKWEVFSCSLACAVAYLETLATDFDFLPENMEIKRGLERKFWKQDKLSIFFDKDFRFAEYKNAPSGNREDGKYLVFFGSNGNFEVGLT